MKVFAPLALVSSTLVLALVANAQIGRPPVSGPQGGGRPAKIVEWHVFKLSDGMYRFNAVDGTTQKMGYVPQQKGIGYKWTTVTEDATMPPNDGPFEVVEGNNKDALAMRIERSSGKAWVMFGVNGATPYWGAVNAQ